MAQTFKTLSDGLIVKKALALLHNNLVFSKTINMDYEGEFNREGSKSGGTILIRKPNQFTVRSGAVMQTQDVTEETISMSVAVQRGVDLNFTDVDLQMSIDNFSKRFLEPAMAKLAATIDQYNLDYAVEHTWNLVGTAFGTKPVLADVASARARLNKGLAPNFKRYLLTESLSANAIIADGKSLYNPASEISKQYIQGKLGRLYGFDHFETEMMPTHTNGTRTDTTPVCNTSTGITSGSDTIAITAFGPSGGTYLAGDVFNIEDVYAVNPETKERQGHLQQFVVKADADATTTNMSVTVYPTPITSGARQNVELVSAGASKSVSNLTINEGSGAASTGYVQNLAYQKDAFTWTTVPLEMDKGAHFCATASYEGINMRIWKKGDITNDQFPCRIDVLFGIAATRPEFACRITT